LLAVATKAKTLHVLDPRSPSTLTSSPSHDSIRPVRVAWISPSHLITTGFSKTATREVLLFSSAPSSLSQIGKQTLDVSPAPLFPHVDVDSGILLLYSRGERSCHAFEINPNDKVPFGRLPSFEHGTLQAGFSFAPKGRNDVKSVEAIRCLRLTPSTVEIVSFTVPRARVSIPVSAWNDTDESGQTEFFQDDVFVHTRDVETPTLEAKEWIEGKNVPLRKIDLRPEGMSLCESPILLLSSTTDILCSIGSSCDRHEGEYEI
jgi:coronin-7